MEESDVDEIMFDVGRFWRFLDELAEKDPDQYKAFILKQARNAQVAMPSKSNIINSGQRRSQAKSSLMDNLANMKQADEPNETKPEPERKKKLIEEINN